MDLKPIFYLLTSLSALWASIILFSRVQGLYCLEGTTAAGCWDMIRGLPVYFLTDCKEAMTLRSLMNVWYLSETYLRPQLSHSFTGGSLSFFYLKIVNNKKSLILK